jgi:hypothetical protein
LALNEVARARMVDVAVQGARTVVDTIAVYRLAGSHNDLAGGAR